MAKPTREDADTLLKVLQLGVASGISEAASWLYSDEYIPNYAQLVKKYPKTSPQYDMLRKLAVHYETIGTFTKHGLISEELVFDLLLIPWERMKDFVLATRKESGEPRLGENFEWLGQRQEAWQKSHPSLAAAATAPARAAGSVAHARH